MTPDETSTPMTDAVAISCEYIRKGRAEEFRGQKFVRERHARELERALVRERAARERAEAERDALREDAERWRWWYTNADFRSDPDMSGNHLWWSCTPPRNLRGGTVEYAIDTARKERP